MAGQRDEIGEKIAMLLAEVQALKAENERLKEELGNWRYALAYCSMEEMPTDSEAVIPTPKGVKKFIDELLEEKTRLKHILTARHIKFTEVSVEELKKIIKLTEQVNPDKTGLSCDHYPKFCECRFAEINKLAQALFDRIYGKGECEQCGACEELIIPEHVKEFANKYGIGLDVIYEYALRWAELKVMKKFNKRNYDAIAQEIKETITDKPKEYCICKEKEPNSDDICVNCGKPIKTEKIEKLAKGDESPTTMKGHISALYKKVDEIIDHINKKGVRYE